MIAAAFAYVGPGPRRTEAPNPCCRRLPQEPMRNLRVLGLLPGLQTNLSHRSGGVADLAVARRESGMC